ncbi:glutathione hydrolase-like YwrD proenzyme [Diadema setosum]|uniref:glutathione hydrolase-like YwrD proenzyme n=1 Tax=Diadema setosum TaxID=31175 RepID=UPI003B3B2506
MATASSEASQYMIFGSRRSPVLSTKGCVACTQPVASSIGLDILKAGGNAADAAVAMAAALNVTEPASTGIGGDCFCLFYDAETSMVKGLNGSGRSAAAASLDAYNKLGFHSDKYPPSHHGLNVTVPGAAAGWVDTVERFGSKKLSLEEILKPAIDLAEEGFAVHPISAQLWQRGSDVLMREGNPQGRYLLLRGNPPRTGDVMRMPMLAHTFKTLASHGKKGFYEGPVAQAIVDIVQANEGILALSDLKGHTSTFVDPISTTYKGVRLWEIPPSGQGITALMALNILEDYDLQEMGHGSPEYLHHVIEAVKLGFADSLEFCADPTKEKVPVDQLLSKEYAATRRTSISPQRANNLLTHGDPYHSGDTVYLSVVDEEGNACSFINSTYTSFGSGLVPKNCGFTLHNRGLNFRLSEGHANCVSGGKRSYHTIIPAMVTAAADSDKDEEEEEEEEKLLACYGVMGGFMQPQGHVQVLLNMAEFGMNPQLALDQPRFCVEVEQPGLTGKVYLEEGIPQSTCDNLRVRGHQVESVSGFDRAVFGRGQVICSGDWWKKEGYAGRGERGEVLWAGSDPRGDGMALGM